MVKREPRSEQRDWGAWLSPASRSKPSAHPLDASRHSSLGAHSRMLTPSGFPNGASCTGRGADATGSRKRSQSLWRRRGALRLPDIALRRRLLFNEQTRAVQKSNTRVENALAPQALGEEARWATRFS